MKKYMMPFLMLCISNIVAVDYVNRDAQYNSEFTKAIELACGDGFLSTGGKHIIDRIFNKISLDGSSLLDFGCGLGGPSLYLAQNNDVAITAVDVEPYVISTAQEKLKEQQSLKGSVDFMLIQEGKYLPFADNQFDFIYAGESILHVQDKKFLLSEFYRILKPAGTLIVNDWLHNSPDYSQAMKDFLQADGLVFHLITPEEYATLLSESGFKNTVFENTSQLTLDDTRSMLKKVDGEMADAIRSMYDEEYLIAYKYGWEQQVVVFQNNEMLTYVITATK